ncbi:hypothetical protein [Deinococcus marmoris]|uniref:hypothetical protein n=1 Tax=Deinococcus marmoris TaxID=249408 RepID=UPI000498091E|nr:hypothetical protein [Deinococcus marmoris]
MDLTILKVRHPDVRKTTRTDPHAAATVAVLGRVLGDAETGAKNKPATPQLDLIAGVTGAQRASLEKEVQDLAQLGRSTDVAGRELGILQALQTEVTRVKAQQDAKKDAGTTNIGAVMNVLRTHHAGHYDGAVAGRLAREALSPT